MIGVDCKTEQHVKRVTDAADKATFRNVQHAAAAIRKDAIASILPEDGPSEPGTAPHTHTQKTSKSGKTRKGNLPRAIVFDFSRAASDAIIGPRESVVGLAGHAHEMGDELFDDEFAERPFMEPALEKNIPRFADSFKASIGG